MLEEAVGDWWGFVQNGGDFWSQDSYYANIAAQQFVTIGDPVPNAWGKGHGDFWAAGLQPVTMEDFPGELVGAASDEKWATLAAGTDLWSIDGRKATSRAYKLFVRSIVADGRTLGRVDGPVVAFWDAKKDQRIIETKKVPAEEVPPEATEGAAPPSTPEVPGSQTKTVKVDWTVKDRLVEIVQEEGDVTLCKVMLGGSPVSVYFDKAAVTKLDGLSRFMSVHDEELLAETAKLSLLSGSVQKFKPLGWENAHFGLSANITDYGPLRQVVPARDSSEAVAPESCLTSLNRVAKFTFTGASDQYFVDAKALQTRSGTFTKVQVSNVDDLFPDGTPMPDHVRQSNLGDCYFQAVLIEIAAKDPNHLKSMFQCDGDTVTVTFYASGKATPVRVEASLPESATGTALYNGGALWVRFIQKAFADFARTNGQYGTLLQAPGAPEGYNMIAGGVAHLAYGVFYQNVQVAEQEVIPADLSDPKQKSAAIKIVNRLLQFNDRAVTTFETVGASATDHIDRVTSLVESITRPKGGKATEEELTDFIAKLASAKAAIVGNTAKLPVASLPDVQTLSKAAQSVQVTLSDDPKIQNQAETTAIRELCLDIRDAGSDVPTAEGEPLFIFSNHAYAVREVSIFDTSGTPFTGPADDTNIDKVDVQNSVVKLQNPHHMNVPSLDGSADQSTGEFSLSLERLARHFGTLDIGKI